MDTLLSRVNLRTKMRLVTRDSEIKTLCNKRGEDVVGMDVAAV
jgi:hypothetical protein